MDAKPPGGASAIYDSMKKFGQPIEFQTHHETPEDFEGTIRLGVSLGAGSIELWQDYKGFPLEPEAKLKRWAAMLERLAKSTELFGYAVNHQSHDRTWVYPFA